MNNANHSEELMHHGIKGMRWGIRRYQNPDGSLTPAGLKRYQNPDGTLTKKGEKFYAKESARLKAETAKVKEAEKVAATKKRTQAKFTKLADKQKKLDERKKALGEDQKETATDKLKGKIKEKTDKPEETLEQRRERLLKSTDPKELYEGRNDLTYQELNDRINRIDLETRLQSKIPKEEKRTITQTMDKAAETITKATNLYNSVDKAYSAVVDSKLGKTLAKKLGIEPPKEKFDLKKFVENMDYASDAEVKAKAARVGHMNLIKKALAELNTDSREPNQEAQRQVDEYNERWRRGESEDRVASSEYRKTGSELDRSADTVGQPKGLPGPTETPGSTRSNPSGNDGPSPSSSGGKNRPPVSMAKAAEKPIDAVEGVDFFPIVYKNPTTTAIMASKVSSVSSSSDRRKLADILGLDPKSVEPKKSSSSTKKETSGADFLDRIMVISDEVDKAAKNQSEIVSRIDTGESITKDFLRRNEEMLKNNK